MDYIKTVTQIKDTIKKAAEPLTEDQEAVLAGCLAFHLDNAFKEGKQSNYCKTCGYLNAKCICDDFYS